VRGRFLNKVQAMSKRRINIGRPRSAASVMARACCLVLGGLAHAPLQAAETPASASPRLAIGGLAHDQGPASDHNEHGIDLNLEVQFAPLDFFGTPRPHLGATLNFSGGTSAAYAGLSFPFYTSSRWLLDGFLGIAVHDGPLHKAPENCRLNSDCGFGTRFLPRLGLEIGYRLDAASAITMLYDHMSHKGIIGGENEGIDHFGLRYVRSF